MKNKYHFNIAFKWFDLWIGLFVDVPNRSLYFCPLPTLVIKVWYTEHETCPNCGGVMYKIACDTGDGWALFWECENDLIFPKCDDKELDWDYDFKGINLVNKKDLKSKGYFII